MYFVHPDYDVTFIPNYITFMAEQALNMKYPYCAHSALDSRDTFMQCASLATEAESNCGESQTPLLLFPGGSSLSGQCQAACSRLPGLWVRGREHSWGGGLLPGHHLVCSVVQQERAPEQNQALSADEEWLWADFAVWEQAEHFPMLFSVCLSPSLSLSLCLSLSFILPWCLYF